MVYASLSDMELLRLLKEGDRLAYAELYERYWAVLFRHARRMLQSNEEAQDVLQDVFTMLWDKAPGLFINSSVSGYLYKSVRYRILDQIDKSKNRRSYLESLAVFIEEGAYSTDTIIREKELSEIVERELNQLPPKMRVVFELSRIDHLSQSEICERLNISGNTVKKQMNNAIKILRRRINLNRLMLVLLYCYLLTKK